MKKLLLVIAGIALLAVACRAEMNVLVDINEDRSATAAFEFGVDDEFKNLIESNGGTSDSLLDEMGLGIERGETFTRTEGDMTYSGVKMEFSDIDDMTAEFLSDEGSDGPFDDFSFVMDDDSAEVKASIVVPDQESEDLLVDPADLSSDFFAANLILTMPGTVVEHNADEVLADGSLRWDLMVLSGEKEVYARSEFGGSTIPWLWIILGLLLVLTVIAIIVAVVLGKKQQKQAVDDAAAAYPQPATEQLGESTPRDETDADDDTISEDADDESSGAAGDADDAPDGRED